MPERSEWLVAGGGAKRTPRYRDTRHYAFEKREYHLLWRPFSRPPDAFLGDDGFPGVALTLNPRLRALRLRPRHSTFQVGYIAYHKPRPKQFSLRRKPSRLRRFLTAISPQNNAIGADDFESSAPRLFQVVRKCFSTLLLAFQTYIREAEPACSGLSTVSLA